MTYHRSAYLSLHENHAEIKGSVHMITYDSQDSEAESRIAEFTFYRPGSITKDAEWLKDMLVQVIEQL